MLKENGVHGLRPRRMIALLLVIVMVLGIFSVRLFQIQIVHGDDYANFEKNNNYLTYVPIAASRGEIVDCNQVPLVSNRTSYAVVLDYNYFPHGSSEEDFREQNECLLALTKILQQEEETWNDSLPISREEPYTFEEGRDSGVSRLKESLRMASYATAEQCIQRLVFRQRLRTRLPVTFQKPRCIASLKIAGNSPVWM